MFSCFKLGRYVEMGGGGAGGVDSCFKLGRVHIQPIVGTMRITIYLDKKRIQPEPGFDRQHKHSGR